MAYRAATKQQPSKDTLSYRQRLRGMTAEIFRAMSEGAPLDLICRMTKSLLHGPNPDQQTIEEIVHAVREVYGEQGVRYFLDIITDSNAPTRAFRLAPSGPLCLGPEISATQRELASVERREAVKKYGDGQDFHKFRVNGPHLVPHAPVGAQRSASVHGPQTHVSAPKSKKRHRTTLCSVSGTTPTKANADITPSEANAALMPPVPVVAPWPRHPLETQERRSVVFGLLTKRVGDLWNQAASVAGDIAVRRQHSVFHVRRRAASLTARIEAHERQALEALQQTHRSSQAQLQLNAAAIRSNLEQETMRCAAFVTDTMRKAQVQLELDAFVACSETDLWAQRVDNSSQQVIYGTLTHLRDTFAAVAAAGIDELSQEISQLETVSGSPHGMWLARRQGAAMRPHMPRCQQRLSGLFAVTVSGLADVWGMSAQHLIVHHHGQLYSDVASRHAGGHNYLSRLGTDTCAELFCLRDRLLLDLDTATMATSGELVAIYEEHKLNVNRKSSVLCSEVRKTRRRTIAAMDEAAARETQTFLVTLDDVMLALGEVRRIEDAEELSGFVLALDQVLIPSIRDNGCLALDDLMDQWTIQDESLAAKSATNLRSRKEGDRLERRLNERIGNLEEWQGRALSALTDRTHHGIGAISDSMAVLKNEWMLFGAELRVGEEYHARIHREVAARACDGAQVEAAATVATQTDEIRLVGERARAVAEKTLAAIAGQLRNHLSRGSLDMTGFYRRVFRMPPDMIRAVLSYSREVLGLDIEALTWDWSTKKGHPYKAATDRVFAGDPVGSMVVLSGAYRPRETPPHNPGGMGSRGPTKDGPVPFVRGPSDEDRPDPNVVLDALLGATPSFRAQVLGDPEFLGNVGYVMAASTTSQRRAFQHLLAGNATAAKEERLTEMAAGLVETTTTFAPFSADALLDERYHVAHHVNTDILERVAHAAADWGMTLDESESSQISRGASHPPPSWRNQLKRLREPHHKDLAQAIILRDENGILAAKLAMYVQRGDADAVAQILYDGKVFSNDPAVVHLAKAKQRDVRRKMVARYPDVAKQMANRGAGNPFWGRNEAFVAELIKGDVTPVQCLSFALDGTVDREALAAHCVAEIGERARLELFRAWKRTHGESLEEGVFGENWGANLSGLAKLDFVDSLYLGDPSRWAIRQRIDNLMSFTDEGWVSDNGLRGWSRNTLERLSREHAEWGASTPLPDTFAPRLQLVSDSIHEHVRMESIRIDGLLTAADIGFLVAAPFTSGYSLLLLSASRAVTPIVIKQAHLGSLYSREALGMDLAAAASTLVDCGIRSAGSLISRNAARKWMVVVDAVAGAASTLLDPKTDPDAALTDALARGLFLGGTRIVADKLGGRAQTWMAQSKSGAWLAKQLPEVASQYAHHMATPTIRELIRTIPAAFAGSASPWRSINTVAHAGLRGLAGTQLTKPR